MGSPSTGPIDSERLKQLAVDEGFELAGVCAAEPSDHVGFLRGWVEEGLHGEMGYLAREDALRRRADPARSLAGARSILVVGHNYHQEDPPGVPADRSRGVIARYARGRDYHRVVKKGLLRVHRRLEEELGEPVAARAYVDTGPLLERELGQRAGLGWFGRNTMLIDPRRGSYFFLGALLLDLALEPDPPFERDHCGSCHACLDACPTGALLGRDVDGAPVMDATRCISYLTIEHRGAIPTELRPLIGNRVYGCDICQEVCPFNVKFAEEAAEPGYAARGPGERPEGVEATGGAPKAATGSEMHPSDAPFPKKPVSAETNASGRKGHEGGPPLHPGTASPPLTELLTMALSEEAWEAFSRGSAIRRAGRAGFARNVCVAMGNWLSGEREPQPDAVAVLAEALSDPEPLVRGHSAWALRRLGSETARTALENHLSREEDPWVRKEVTSSGPG